MGDGDDALGAGLLAVWDTVGDTAMREAIRTFWASSGDAMAVSDPEGIVLLANPAYHALYGYGPEAVIGRSFAVIFPEPERDGAVAAYRAVFRGPARTAGFEAVVRRADGDERIVDSRYTFFTRGERRVAMLSIVRDITDRKRLEAELEEAVRQREGFLAIAAHELRTPLTTLKGTVQLVARQLRRPAFDRERALAQFVRLEGRIDHLTSLVGDILDVSQLRRGQLPLHPTRLDLVALAREVLAHFAEAPERAAAHELVLDADGALWLTADRGRLEQVLTNLIANALKYSPEGGEVRCTVREEGGWATLAVRDHGLGIAPGVQGRLFQPFARVAPERAIRGLGLGLYIARELVERHGGAIALISTPGVGTTVTVRLPLAARASDVGT